MFVVAAGAGYGGFSDVQYDLRVDDHRDPCTELARLVAEHDLIYASSDPQALLPLIGETADEVRALLVALGHGGVDDPAGLEAALASWAGIANLEGRLVAGKIDPLVLHELRRADA